MKNLKINNVKYLVISLVFIFCGSNSIAQTSFEYKGYVSNLESAWLQKNIDIMLISGTFQNRFDFFVYPIENTTVNVGLRNILEYGNIVLVTPGYGNMATTDNGYLNLTQSWRSKSNYVIYSQLDRLNLFYANDAFEFQVGRQRVNWGVNLVWTPNDIFNSTSFLNFDYEEKQGSDAIRGQYYFDYLTSIEFVYKLDKNAQVTSALMFRTNKWNYDLQAFVGMMETDYVFGAGWAGDILSSNFSGEVTYFRNKENFNDTTGQLVASLGWTYTFASDFYVHGEFLYNSLGTTNSYGGITNINSGEYNAKMLSTAKYSVFGQIAYQLNPLVRIDVSSIINTNDKSFYIGPFASFSVSQNTDLLFAGQFFFGDNFTEWGDLGDFYFLKIKWSF